MISLFSCAPSAHVSNEHPVVLVDAKGMELSCRILFPSTDIGAENRQEYWRKGMGQLVRYLDDVGTAVAGMLTNGQEWLFVEWVDDRGRVNAF